MDLVLLAVLFAGLAVAGAGQAVLGRGFLLVAAPALMLTAGWAEGLRVALLLGLVVTVVEVLGLGASGRAVRLRDALPVLLPGVLAAPLWVWLVGLLPDPVAGRLAGAVILLTVLKGLLPTLILSVAAPLVTFNVVKANGASDIAAYLWAAVGPLVETVGTAVIKRELDRISLLILSLTVGSAAVALIGNTSDTVLLLKDSALTGLFGLICLSTLFIGKPLMYSFANKFSSAGQTGEFDRLWANVPQFRRTFRVITGVWGVGFLIEAGLKVAAAETLPFGTAYNVNQVLPIVFAVLLTAFTILFGKWAQARGKAQAAARGA